MLNCQVCNLWNVVQVVLIPTSSARGIEEEEGIGEERLKRIGGGEEEGATTNLSHSIVEA